MNLRTSLLLFTLFMLFGCNNSDPEPEPEDDFSGHYEYRKLVSAPLHFYHLIDDQIEEITHEGTLAHFKGLSISRIDELLDNCDDVLSPAFIDAITLDVNSNTGVLTSICDGESSSEAITYTKEGRLITIERENFTYKAVGELLDYDFYNLCLYVIYRVSWAGEDIILEIDEIKNCETFGLDDEGLDGFRMFVGEEEDLPYLFENTLFEADTLAAIQIYLKEK